MSKRFSIFLLGAAILVGALYVAPQFLIRQRVVASGQHFVLSQFSGISDEAHIYFQRAREGYDGGFPAKNLFFDDRRPDPFPIVPAIAFYPFMLAAKGDLNSAYLLLSFILPAILFLIFYFLGEAIFEKNWPWSTFFAFVGTLTPLAIHSVRALLTPANFLNIAVKNFYPGISTLLDRLFLNRIDDPLITYLIFLPAILFLIVFWKKPKVSSAVLAGIFAGLLFYAYFHYWVYWVIVLCVLFVVALLFFRQDRVRIKNLILLGAVAVLVSAPYWVNYLNFRGSPGAAEYTQRIGVDVGRKIILADAWPDYLAYAAMMVVVYFVFWRKGRKLEAALFFSFLIAIFLAWNVQVVTGFVPQPDHFRKAIGPLFLVMLFAVIYEIGRRYSKKKVLTILSLAVLLLVAKKVVNVVMFANPPQDVLASYSRPEPITASWDWINSDLPREPRIISDSFLSSFYLAGFTTARPFLPWGVVAPGPNRAIEDRFLIANKVFGLSPEALKKRLVGNQEDEALGIYEHYYDAQGSRIPMDKIFELADRYRNLKISLVDLPADYIYYGPDEQKIGGADSLADRNLKLVYDLDGVRIYQILR